MPTCVSKWLNPRNEAGLNWHYNEMKTNPRYRQMCEQLEEQTYERPLGGYEDGGGSRRKLFKKSARRIKRSRRSQSTKRVKSRRTHN